MGDGINREKYELLKIGWKRAKKKYQEEGKKGTKLCDFMATEKKGQNASGRFSQKRPAHMTEKL